MNKQEAIKYFENKKNGYAVPPSEFFVGVKEVIDIISQIQSDEPQKVVIPQFVAEWLVKHQTSNDLFNVIRVSKDYVNGTSQSYVGSEKINSWIAYNYYNFIRAWLDGYEVEQEKLYTVEIPDPQDFEWAWQWAEEVE